MVMAMSKYARPVDHSKNATDIRMLDVIDTAIYSPRPEWGQTDDGLLSKIFAPEKAKWVAAGTWFVTVPNGVQPGARFAGKDYLDAASYLNPDGSNGNGEFPPPPEQ